VHTLHPSETIEQKLGRDVQKFTCVGLATDRQSRPGFLYFISPIVAILSVSNGRFSAVCLLSENSGKPLLQKFTEKFEAFAFSKGYMYTFGYINFNNLVLPGR
jgi:hypothetical protein